MTLNYNFTKSRFRSLPIMKILIEGWTWLVFGSETPPMLHDFAVGPWRKKYGTYWLITVKLKLEMNQNAKQILGLFEAPNFDANMKKKTSQSNAPPKLTRFWLRRWWNKSTLYLQRTICMKNKMSLYWKHFFWIIRNFKILIRKTCITFLI